MGWKVLKPRADTARAALTGLWKPMGMNLLMQSGCRKEHLAAPEHSFLVSVRRDD